MLYLNGDRVNVTLFPDNTSQIWKLDESHFNQERATILWEFSHEGEVMQLAQLKQLLDQSIDRVYLHIEYLPYGRQDKYIRNDATFALWSFGAVINSLNFEEIFIMDPHSEVALAILHKSRAVYPHGPLGRAMKMTEAELVCYPDKGARTKYSEIYKLPVPYIFGEKVRNQATGHIEAYDLFGDPAGKIVMIVDDICDGGKTFEILADQLFSNGVDGVNLFVTHGIFSKGLMPLKKAGIDRIFTNKGEVLLMGDGGFKTRNWEQI